MEQLTLTLNNTEHTFKIENNFVNAGKICKLGNKNLFDYRKVKGHLKLFDEISADNDGLELFIKKFNITWINLKIIHHMAKWISNDFYSQICKQIPDEMKKIFYTISVTGLKNKIFDIGINITNMKLKASDIGKFVDTTFPIYQKSKYFTNVLKKMKVSKEDVVDSQHGGRQAGTWVPIEIGLDMCDFKHKMFKQRLEESLQVQLPLLPKYTATESDKGGLSESKSKEDECGVTESKGNEEEGGVTESKGEEEEVVSENEDCDVISFDSKDSITDIVCTSFLFIENIKVIARKSDGYINLTSLCKAGSKEFFKWNENAKTKAFLQVLSSSLRIRMDELLRYESGSIYERATWGHPQVAINIAQWISPEFDVQVSKWIFELLVIGKVEVGKEKSNEKLDNIYMEKLKKLENEKMELENINMSLVNHNTKITKNYLHLEKLHDDSLKRKSHYKFKRGNCLYLVKDNWRQEGYIKFGKTGNINERLQQYRTGIPEIKILFLVFVNEMDLLEDIIKQKNRDILTHQNHEYILKISSTALIDQILGFLTGLNFRYRIDETIDKYNNPYNYLDLPDSDAEPEEEEMVFSEEEDDEEEVVETKDAGEDRVFECENCDKCFINKSSLVMHLINKHDRKDLDIGTKCHDCDKIFRDRGKLKRHIETVHEKKFSVKCDLCEQVFGHKDAMIFHRRNIHEKKFQMKCDICGLTSSSRGNYNKHIKTMHNKPEDVVHCEICDKQFNHKVYLKAHMDNVHERKNEKSCEICGDHFVSLFGYTNHMLASHKEAV